MRMSEENWDDVINVNLKSVFNVTKAASKVMMKNRKGSFINLSSVVGVQEMRDRQTMQLLKLVLLVSLNLLLKN